MRLRAPLLGLTLALVALSMTALVGQEPSPQTKTKPAGEQPPINEAVTKLLKTQLQAAPKPYRAALDTMVVERSPQGFLVLANGNHARIDLVHTWSVRWLHAQRNLSKTKEERIAAFVDHQKRMKELRDNVAKILVAGGKFAPYPASEGPATEWYLAEAELWLLRERGK